MTKERLRVRLSTFEARREARRASWFQAVLALALAALVLDGSGPAFVPTGALALFGLALGLARTTALRARIRQLPSFELLVGGAAIRARAATVAESARLRASLRGPALACAPTAEPSTDQSGIRVVRLPVELPLAALRSA